MKRHPMVEMKLLVWWYRVTEDIIVTYQGIKQNKNHSRIASTFQDIEFLLKNLTKKFIQN